MKNKLLLSYSSIIVFVVIIILGFKSCTGYNAKRDFRKSYKEVNSLIHDTKYLYDKPFLKAHYKNGNVAIYKEFWLLDTVQNAIYGEGILYDFNRNIISEGELLVPIESVILFETNQMLTSSENKRLAGMTIVTVANLALTTYCMINPKACFGSCPTFYVEGNDDFFSSDAEGFSNAITPSLEYYDIDALNNPPLENNRFSLTMKNEALETHLVKSVKLLAYPRADNERIYHSRDDKFYLCENKYLISKATDGNTDVTSLLRYADIKERTSLADEKNLKSKEEIILNFDNINDSNELGLILHFRQSLMTTYLIYNLMGYMGDELSDYFAKIEKDNNLFHNMYGGLKKELGDIDIYLWDSKSKNWIFQGAFDETGPIAINKQILALDNIINGSSAKLKIVINKGYWRIDYVALTNIRDEVKPIEVLPSVVLNHGKIDSEAIESLNHPDEYLISMPASEYKMTFDLPEQSKDYELFLYSEGYYLQWMRPAWLADKDISKIWQMYTSPHKYLRNQAKDYKQYELTMEEQFWNSKINKEMMVNYEN
jgi:hypothetical protein